MIIFVEKPGLLTTVQDLGRAGYRRFGINPGGVMDRAAARMANLLVGNDEAEALLEMHFPGPQLRFETNAVIAVCGADLSPAIDGTEAPTWKPIFISAGSVLTFGVRRSGTRAYLAVYGGARIDKWLGSRSTNLTAGVGGYQGRALKAGDPIELECSVSSLRDLATAAASPELVPRYSRFPTVRIIAGAEFDLLTESSRKLLIGQDYSISNDSNRMGFRLSGEPLALERPFELLSSAVSYGTIQLLPDGQLIVLMADHQTTGGYPRVAHVISRDLPLMGQLGPGDKVAFHVIGLEEAEALAAEFEEELRFFRVGCRFQANLWTS